MGVRALADHGHTQNVKFNQSKEKNKALSHTLYIVAVRVIDTC